MKFFVLAFTFSTALFSATVKQEHLLTELANCYPDFFTIDESSISTTKITNMDYLNENFPFYPENEFSNNKKDALKQPGISLEVDLPYADLINLGKDLWEIIKEGRPVVNINSNWASAMPEIIEHWTQLENWEMPEAQNYSFSARNALGVTVVDVEYRIIYTWGGSLEGKGKYLCNVKVIPLKYYVLWGYTLNINVEVPTLFNTGSKGDPVAGLELVVTSQIKTPLVEMQKAQTYFISGAGKFKAVE